MKKILILLAVTSMFLTSCSDSFLEVESKNSLLESNYYNSQERLFTGLVAAYDPLQWFPYFYQYNSINFISDIMADDIFCGGSNDGDQPVLVKAHYYTATPNDVCNQVWTICYSGINRANIVIQKAPEVTMDEGTKALYVAEAKILKAYYWNLLWKFWGNLPYYEDNLDASASYSSEQLPANEIYAKVIAIIEDAITANVLPMKAAAGQEGRVTKAMAYMLYTEMVMYQNDESRYSKAFGYMTEIINSGNYSLNPNFANIWEESGEWTNESIWEVNFECVNGGRSWDAPLQCGGTVYPVLIGVPGPKDPAYVDGWGFSPVANTAYEMYDAKDSRRDGGILALDEGQYTARWQATGKFLLKYIARTGGNHEYAADPNLNYGNNLRVYRYSEVLLNAAELAVRGAGSGADGYLNEVRARAGVGTISASLDNIIEERRLEFLGEGKRYWDLVRTGKAAAVLAAGTHPYRVNGWTESKKYWPIPQSEIDKSVTGLTQNPY